MLAKGLLAGAIPGGVLGGVGGQWGFHIWFGVLFIAVGGVWFLGGGGGGAGLCLVFPNFLRF